MDEELAAFCRREHARLVGTLVLVVGSREVAEDLAQEALARVCRDWRRVHRMAAPGAYAHRVALNLATSWFRRRAAERRAAGRWHALSGRQEEAAAGLPDEADAIAIRRALGQLKAPQRKVLVCRYFLGYSVQETADVLAMPAGSVKTHAFRGIATLRELLGVEITEGDTISCA